jgi:hypothetical protein
MVWLEVLLALVRCELKAQFNGWGGWQLSAKGVLPIVLLCLLLAFVWVQ